MFSGIIGLYKQNANGEAGLRDEPFGTGTRESDLEESAQKVEKILRRAVGSRSVSLSTVGETPKWSLWG